MATKINLPNGWNEVTLSRFAEMQQASDPSNDEMDGGAAEWLAILTGATVEEIESLPLSEVKQMVSESQWALEPPTTDYQEAFTIDGQEYGIIPDFSKMTLGEHQNMELYSNGGVIENLHKIMALLYRPVKRRGIFRRKEVEAYDTKTSPARAELFKEKLTVDKAYGAALFFSLFGMSCMASTLDSSEMLDMILRNHLLENQPLPNAGG